MDCGCSRPAGTPTCPGSESTSSAITLAQATTLAAGDVTVSSAIGANYGPVTVSGSGTSYTITLAQPINKADRVTITIGNATIATFTRRLDVLPGDFNDDGVVNAQDLVGRPQRVAEDQRGRPDDLRRHQWRRRGEPRGLQRRASRDRDEPAGGECEPSRRDGLPGRGGRCQRGAGADRDDEPAGAGQPSSPSRGGGLDLAPRRDPAGRSRAGLEPGDVVEDRGARPAVDRRALMS